VSTPDPKQARRLSVEEITALAALVTRDAAVHATDLAWAARIIDREPPSFYSEAADRLDVELRARGVL